jgi:exopolysaccharide production protein ExoQ
MEKAITKFEYYFSVISIILFCDAILPLLRPGAIDLSNSQVMGVDPVEGSITNQIIYILIYIITFSLLITKVMRKDRGVIYKLFWFDLLMILVIVSISWTGYPLLTIRKIIGILGTTLFGFYFASRFPITESLKLTNFAFCIMAILSLITGIILPHYGVMAGQHEGAWRGIFIHKNILGRMMSMYTIMAYSLLRICKNKVYLWHILLAICLVILSKSASAIIITALLLMFGHFLKIQKLPLPLVIFLTGIFIILIFGISVYVSENFDTLLTSFGKDATLTGRTELWGELFKMIAVHPILGYGYGGFWTGGIGESAIVDAVTGWSVAHAHNGYINVMLDLGCTGLALYLIIFFKNYLSFFGQYFLKRRDVFIWGILFFTYLLATNLSESEILETNDIFWVLFIYAVFQYKFYTKKKLYLIQ